MRALLDISILLALIDEEHDFHERSRQWWQANREPGWASCPLTQNGFVRVISQASYARPVPLLESIRVLTSSTSETRHEFWPDDLSLLDTGTVDHTRLLGPSQLTDVYLLALAVKHGGRFVTLDRRVPLAAVRGAQPENLVVV
jgi:uncharacterized protein